jgi:phosphatidylethanolamine/phosphatidyl-N-methylethanolamine N-methyltransferase
MPASLDLGLNTVTAAYGHWAKVYDALCGPVFWPAHRALARQANLAGRRILEVGVGTGLVLSRYDRRAAVMGIDVSDAMLARARKRVVEEGLSHVVRLERQDVTELDLVPGSLDCITMPFVLTLLHAPEEALSRCLAALRPGGEIVIVSHFRSGTRVVADFERWLAPRIAALGLRPDFPVERLRDFVDAHPQAAALHVTSVRPFGIYKLVRIVRA